MPIGTLDRTPPPFFRQGPSALTKLTFCSALAVLLMVADVRFQITQPLRSVLATVLHPLQRALLAPVDAVTATGDYVGGLRQAREREQAARVQLAAQAERAARVEQLQAENRRLRALLELRPALAVRSHPAEVLYEAADPFSRKVVIDRGVTDGVVAGSPVVNESGVLGQVTRVYPFSAEVTLLTDKDASIPVLNTRTQARGAAYGTTSGPGLELRFMAANADVQVGDVLQTSGIDGIYPPGIAVAKVLSVDRRVDSGFARIALAPAAPPDGVRQVLVLEPLAVQLPAKPATTEPNAPDDAPPAKKKGRKK